MFKMLKTGVSSSCREVTSVFSRKLRVHSDNFTRRREVDLNIQNSLGDLHYKFSADRLTIIEDARGDDIALQPAIYERDGTHGQSFYIRPINTWYRTDESHEPSDVIEINIG